MSMLKHKGRGGINQTEGCLPLWVHMCVWKRQSTCVCRLEYRREQRACTVKVAVEGKSTRVLEIGNRPGPGGSVRWSIIPCTKGWGFDPQSEHMQRQLINVLSYINLSPFLSLFPPPQFNKNISSGEDLKNY